MKSICRLVIVLPLLIVGSGCVGVLRVSDGGGKSLPGVPFFPKKATCRQETTYVGPVVLVTKVDTFLDSAGKVIRTDSETKPFRLSEGKTALTKLSACLASPSQCGNDPTGSPLTFPRVWKQLAGSIPVPDSPDKLKPEDLILVGNKVSASTFVDYNTTTYLNGNLPWLGSNEVSLELNEDGSLSKASGKAESKIADLIPIKEGLSAIFHLSAAAPKSGSAGPADAFAEAASTPRVTTLSVDIKFFQYLFARNSPVTSPCNLPAAITLEEFAKGGIEFSWSQPGADDKTKKDSASSDDKSKGKSEGTDGKDQ
jgi:hypothetical protein